MAKRRMAKFLNPQFTSQEVKEWYGSFFSVVKGETGWYWFDPSWDEHGPYESEDVSETARLESGLFELCKHPVDEVQPLEGTSYFYCNLCTAQWGNFADYIAEGLDEPEVICKPSINTSDEPSERRYGYSGH